MPLPARSHYTLLVPRRWEKTHKIVHLGWVSNREQEREGGGMLLPCRAARGDYFFTEVVTSFH